MHSLTEISLSPKNSTSPIGLSPEIPSLPKYFCIWRWSGSLTYSPLYLLDHDCWTSQSLPFIQSSSPPVDLPKSGVTSTFLWKTHCKSLASSSFPALLLWPPLLLQSPTLKVTNEPCHPPELLYHWNLNFSLPQPPSFPTLSFNYSMTLFKFIETSNNLTH